MCCGSMQVWLAAPGMVRRGQNPPRDQGMGDGCAGSACPSPSLPVPSQAPWHRLGNNLPAAFPFPSCSQEHPNPRSDAIRTQAMLGVVPAPCMRADVPGTLCPNLDPVSHPELGIRGRGEQVSKAMAVSNSPAPGGLGFPNPLDLGAG